MSGGGPGRRVTLAHVAERAGVSRSAVSFVLSGRTDQRLSEETSARVRRAAEELGYRPNAAARTLRTGRSGTVALVSDFVASTSHANSMVRGALEALRDEGSLLFTVDTQGDPGLEAQVVENLLSRSVDGVLYASMFTRSITVPAALQRVPYVLLNCVPGPGVAARAVVPDEEAAGRAAGEHLLDLGHRDGVWFVGAFRPGFTGGAAWHGWSPLALTERLRGLEAALDSVGATLAGRVPIDADWDPHDGRAAVAGLLASGVRPRALVCANDAVAAGAYQALRRAGLDVPADVSVVGFDGSAISRALDPPLTSVALPQAELGRLAAQLLLGDPTGPPGPPTTADVRRVPMPLVLGESTAPPP
ncbi:LacI family DNA-binding transcriptional regulator [Kineococcus endophyticus]|uniref:LacI family DNA-binding transcriptional regulator n=1 Tax=Kineococcus endophyticus TaxID=1181883 RepID=A0ABV3P4Y9_9ACTN